MSETFSFLQLLRVLRSLYSRNLQLFFSIFIRTIFIEIPLKTDPTVCLALPADIHNLILRCVQLLKTIIYSTTTNSDLLSD